ncbi:zinc-binding alcohol dehydrogenase (cinnamyl alcohol dehydrogenase) [Stagonosporopsis vannaccii]|nr:zinc-binding alcohol dehydrogenase (cinnamyl alcohol dehydrogenase) [Stagonosporopsis vannaccii]
MFEVTQNSTHLAKIGNQLLTLRDGIFYENVNTKYKYPAAADKKIGVIGVGSLGSLAIPFAKAMVLKKVVSISRSGSDREDLTKMGANEYVARSDDSSWVENDGGSLDIVVCAVSSNKEPLREYLNLLGLNGMYIQVLLPDHGFIELDAGVLVSWRIKLTGSSIGSPKEMRDMLKLAAAQNSGLGLRNGQ